MVCAANIKMSREWNRAPYGNMESGRSAIISQRRTSCAALSGLTLATKVGIITRKTKYAGLSWHQCTHTSDPHRALHRQSHKRRPNKRLWMYSHFLYDRIDQPLSKESQRLGTKNSRRDADYREIGNSAKANYKRKLGLFKGCEHIKLLDITV